MRRIKSSVKIQLPKTEVVSRAEKPSELKGVHNKYKDFNLTTHWLWFVAYK